MAGTHRIIKFVSFPIESGMSVMPVSLTSLHITIYRIHRNCLWKSRGVGLFFCHVQISRVRTHRVRSEMQLPIVSGNDLICVRCTSL